MNQLRATLRLGAFFIWCGGAFAASLLAQLMIVLMPSVGVSAKRITAKVWARGVCLIIGLQVDVQGSPPEPPFILVSNHLSYIDIVTLMSVIPGVFVAKSEVANWPLLGPLSRVASTIFVDRQSKKDVVRVNAEIDRILARGEGLIMFPEGTSSQGRSVLPFRSSLLQPACSAGHPVNYASLSYHTPSGAPPAEMSVCWWGDMTFGDHFWGLLQLPSIEGSISFGDQSVAAGSRHELAHALQIAVIENFRPVSDTPEGEPETKCMDLN
ncbi:MAG: lysophospholipid acyltransferase family protein [Planctomycetota bacterium]|nr:lysophospholipid acyltransferase family protein [Planctomycetota bacterium]